MNPDRSYQEDHQPPVSSTPAPDHTATGGNLWDVTIYHTDGRVEDRQVDFAEMVRLAAGDNLKFTAAPALASAA